MSNLTPYYRDDYVTIWHADCRDLLSSIRAEFLVTDPPYGIGWKRGSNPARASKPHAGIANDEDTSVRDEVLGRWNGPAVVFGSLAAPRPAGTVQTLIWHKPPDSGVVGSVTGFRRDVEAIYLCGKFPQRTVQWSSVLQASRPDRDTGHPHAKPVDLMTRLIALAPGIVLDPFMGSGSTLVAAKLIGRQAVGIELEEAYCEMAASRCAQEVLDLGEAA
jgi:site-specific DNA-methyltransferase (adenine-specific)